MAKTTIVQCPTCSVEVVWTAENRTKPFCCERCKLIDLGEWANETRTIPGEPVDPAFIIPSDESWQ